MASAALTVSISALASSIIALMPRWMVWGIDSPSCPGRGAAFFMPLRRAGTVTNAVIWYGPGSAAHRSAKSYAALRPGHETLPHQFLHRAFQPLDRDRIHALRKQPADDGGGFRIVPVPLRHRVEPHRVRIGPGDALQPDRSGFLVDVCDRTAGHHHLVRAHR